MRALLIALMSVCGGASDDDFEASAAAFRAEGDRRAPARMQHDSAKHDIEVSDESSCDGCCPTPSMPTARRRDGRGKYDRSDGKGSRMAWKPFVQKHMEAVTTGNISAWLADAKCACNKDCPQFGKCIEAVGTIRTLKICAAESFGEAALSQDWERITPNHAATAAWFKLALGGRLVDPSGKVTDVVYKVGDQRVCLPAWGAMRGVPPTTANTIDRAVRAGEMTWNDGMAAAADNSLRTANATLRNAAWWMTRLGYYEAITARGLILYPRDTEWAAVYADEFVPEMRLLGHHWKLPKARAGGDEPGEADAGDGKGSMGSWYAGRAEALQELAEEKLGPNSEPFKFKSRAKHSAYKECHDCQTKRLAIRDAIRRGASPDEIRLLKEDYANHLQWMIKQRRKQDSIIQMATHEQMIVENSDKCGDDCFYLPNASRASSRNVSKYKYRLSLQANVYAGKLFHLMLLLPNLVTGADFGVTARLSGLVRMFKLGQITSGKRRLLSGMDGGSENVNFVGLGMNSTLVKELHEGSITEVQQHRLPPDHSHHWITDGTFSVMEGWLCHDGFPGCATIWDLIDYLRSQFAKANGYKDKEVCAMPACDTLSTHSLGLTTKACDSHPFQVEVTVLLVTFAFTKWFDGCINQDQMTGIGRPLVWRHRCCPPLPACDSR
jgi:hypothetical protein